MGTARSGWATAVMRSRLDQNSRNSKRWISFLLLCVCFSMAATAQQSANQRSFFTSSSEISGAIVKIGATTKGRLPTLDGFVHQPDQPIERYSKGYFECAFQQLPPVDGSITVRVVAKVSAWYTDPDPAQSGYRVLSSNGRLESDALDRLAEVLPANASDGNPSRPPTPSPAATAPAYSYRSSPASSAPSLDLNTHSSAPSYSSRPATPAPAAGSNLDIVKSNRAADEKKAADLKTYVSNMEEIQRNQAHPSDLAAVKKARTPVYAKPSESAQVLMHADAQDEFQVLGLEGPWVHIQISGASRGWIQNAQLEMPPGFAQAQGANDSAAPSGPFKVSKEETTSFHGDWATLKGKSVRIEWVEPATPSLLTSRKDKLAFAKAVFLQASEKLPASKQQPDGIVVVFDSIDGGQIAAALPTVQALANHSLSDVAFWHQCSIDPPDSFLDPKP
jgi:hypothetical protein